MLVTHRSTIAPAAPASGYSTLFIDDTDGRMKVKQSDGSVDVLILNSDLTGLFFDFTKQSVTPGVPATGANRMYFDTSNRLKAVLHDGTVISPGGSAVVVDYNVGVGKTATDTIHDADDRAADQLIAPDHSSIWQGDSDTAQATIDLGAAYQINKVIIENYQVTKLDGDNASYNSVEYLLQWSDNNTTFTTFEHVTGNTADINTFTGLSLTHRYFRISMIQGETYYPGGRARIGKFKLIMTGLILPVQMDENRNAYITMPDNVVIPMRSDEFVDFNYHNYPITTPPLDYARLYIDDDGHTPKIRDDAGDTHTIISNPGIGSLFFNASDSGLSFGSGYILMWIGSDGYLNLEGKGRAVMDGDEPYRRTVRAARLKYASDFDTWDTYFS